MSITALPMCLSYDNDDLRVYYCSTLFHTLSTALYDNG